MLELTVVQALPKGDRGELAVDVMTEVGVDTIVPWAAARSVTQWSGERGDKALRKWQAHAVEASKQSRRTWFSTVAPLASTADVVALIRDASLAVVLHEDATTSLAAAAHPRLRLRRSRRRARGRHHRRGARRRSAAAGAVDLPHGPDRPAHLDAGVVARGPGPRCWRPLGT